jgi:large subunit ribosomal protein L19
MMNRLMKIVEEATMKKDLPKFEIGDTVDVHLRILEGNKERVQIFQGTVIALRGDGVRAMFTVRRVVQGEGVERTFPVHSPKIAKIEVKRSGETRRAKLYYLRDRVGKATRLRERKQKETPAQAEASAAKRSRKKAASKTEKTEKKS